ncbi:hypothetical protein [Endozoicomonas montiporae]|nr:hypothetical protein [Endozoicomonas montiporae]
MTATLLPLVSSMASAVDEHDHLALVKSDFEPFVDLNELTYQRKDLQLDKVFRDLGLGHLALAYVTSDPWEKGDQRCSPMWGGQLPYNVADFTSILNNEQLGQAGVIRVSFGGGEGSALADVCGNAEKLSEAYKKFADLGVSKFDFSFDQTIFVKKDVLETHISSIELLRDKGVELDIQYTFLLEEKGVSDAALGFIGMLIDQKVEVSRYNLLASKLKIKRETGTVGRNIQLAVEETVRKIHELYKQKKKDKSERDVYEQTVIAPMIGLTDAEGVVFKLADIDELIGFARANHVNSFSMWSLNRDRRCKGDTKEPEPYCSGVDQEDYAFSTRFNSYRHPQDGHGHQHDGSDL